MKRSNISTALTSFLPKIAAARCCTPKQNSAKEMPKAAVTLLDPFSPSDKDTSFLALLGEALLRTGRLDRAREVFDAYYKQKPDSFGKLFEVAGAYVRSGAGSTKPPLC